MASFPIINKVTGEKKVINKSVHDIQQWYEDNPEWQRDWSEGCAKEGFGKLVLTSVVKEEHLTQLWLKHLI